jgi:flagellar hook assembly protein FlgD
VHLHPNFPNPFADQTAIPFSLPETGHVSIRVYDIRGALVATLAERVFGRGLNEVLWDGRHSDGRPVSSGIYFLQVKFEGKTAQRKIVILR